jgi:hypothetical protein
VCWVFWMLLGIPLVGTISDAWCTACTLEENNFRCSCLMYLHVCARMCVYAFTYVCEHRVHVHVGACVCMFVHMYACVICMCACAHVCMCACVRGCTCTRAHLRAHYRALYRAPIRSLVGCFIWLHIGCSLGCHYKVPYNVPPFAVLQILECRSHFSSIVLKCVFIVQPGRHVVTATASSASGAHDVDNEWGATPAGARVRCACRPSSSRPCG